MSVLDRVLPLLTIAAAFGCETLPDGTRLIGKVPHVAPEAWLHVVGRRLTPEEIRQLESELGKRISGEFRAFLSDANGLSVFSDSISLFGLRTSYRREPSDAFQPYSLVTPNAEERPPDAPEEALFVGSYRWDGSLLFIDPDGRVHRCRRDSAGSLQSWPSFNEMLVSEVERLSGLFDHSGRPLDLARPTTP